MPYEEELYDTPTIRLRPVRKGMVEGEREASGAEAKPAGDDVRSRADSVFRWGSGGFWYA